MSDCIVSKRVLTHEAASLKSEVSSNDTASDRAVDILYPAHSELCQSRVHWESISRRLMPESKVHDARSARVW